MKEHVVLVIREHVQYTVSGLSSNNSENDDYFFNQLRSCHVTFSEDKHDICTTTRCATMSVYRSPFCLASLISDNQQRVRQDDRFCAGQSASIPSRWKFTSIERFFLISSPPVTTTDYFVKNVLTAIRNLSQSENYAAISHRCNYIKLNSAVLLHSIGTILFPLNARDGPQSVAPTKWSRFRRATMIVRSALISVASPLHSST